MKKAILMTVVLALLLSGCMTVPQDVEPPELSIESIPPTEQGANLPTAGQLTVNEQYFYTLTTHFAMGIFLAEVENTSDSPCQFAPQTVNLRNEGGEVVASLNEFKTIAPKVLAPGEVGYLTATNQMGNLTPDEVDNISGFEMELEQSSVERAPEQDFSQLEITDLTLNSEAAALEGTIHNHSEEDIKKVRFIIIVRNQDGKLNMAEQVLIGSVAANDSTDFSQEITVLDPTADYEDIVFDYLFYVEQ